MSVRRIVACGGGNPTTSSRPLFEAGLDLTGAAKPNILLVPTAKYKRTAYHTIASNFATYTADRELNFRVFHDFGELPTPQRAAELLDWADAAYFTGGHTEHAVRQWREGNIDDVIYQTVDTGQVTAIGTSAGFLCWFTWCQSDARQYEVEEGEPWEYIETSGLGMFDAVAGVHHDKFHPLTGKPRKLDFDDQLRKHVVGTVGVSSDNAIAMRIVGDRVSVLSTGQPGLLHRKEVVREGELACEVLGPSSEEFPISLFTRVTV